MLDASTPAGQEGSQTNSSGNSGKKKKSQNNNRRFWPQEFGNMQPNLESGTICRHVDAGGCRLLMQKTFTGMLSSSDDEGDSYSSDEEGGGLIIDAPQPAEVNQNGHQADSNLAVFGNGEAEVTRQ